MISLCFSARVEDDSKGMKTVLSFSLTKKDSNDGSIGSNYFYKQQYEHTSFACIIPFFRCGRECGGEFGGWVTGFREIYDPNQSLGDFEWRIKLSNEMKPTLIKTSLSPNPDIHNENCLSCSLTFTLVSIASRSA